ncbi:hypothetical protein MMC26_002413 [Xylographa opegraphella]|nr:hypothetical protein [Xylographa opegraphella]
MIPSKPVAHVALTWLSAHSLVQGVALTDNNYYGITIGSPFDLTWSGDGTPVNITLVDGSPANVIPVAAIAINAPSPSYRWTPSISIPVGEYALAIIQSGSTNYAGPFYISAADSQTSQNPPTSSAMGPIVPSTSSITPRSACIMTASSASASATGEVSSGFVGTGARTGTAAPYPTGGANGTWMENATVSVTVTEDYGCAEETGVSAGYGGNGGVRGSGASGPGSSASSSGARFAAEAGCRRTDGMRVGLMGGMLVTGLVVWLA